MDSEVRGMYYGLLCEKGLNQSRVEKAIANSLDHIATCYAGGPTSIITAAGVKVAIKEMDEFIRVARLTRTRLRRLVR